MFVAARGYCRPHYNRWQRHGDPCAGKAPRGCTDLERFWWYVRQPDGPDGCWIWTAGVVSNDDRNDYGVISLQGGGQMLVHRWAWEHFKGEIPHGHEIDHLCRVHRCCNPNHLEPVPHRENMLRSMRLGRPVKREQTVCTVAECAKIGERREMCQMHYRRWRKHGDPTVVFVQGTRSGQRAE